MMYTPAIRFESFLNGKHPEIKSNILEYNDVRYHVFKY
ncbi:hypothetical protein Xoosp13_380 [Xanthomonas phage Xoo-sp13]|nr:hypothetical protein Xoosp13_380 [Xanthomonas phage Xoo-sp13]